MTAFLTAFGLAGAAGLNAYVPLMAIAVLARLGLVHLAPPFDLLASTWALVAIGVLLTVEVIVDKVPGADHVNDLVQTVVRPAAGALAFGAATGAIADAPGWLTLAAGLVTAFSVHSVKAAARPAVNASTLGLGAPIISVLEDIVAVATSLIALLVPYLVALVALGFVVLAFVLWRRRRRRRDRERAGARG